MSYEQTPLLAPTLDKREETRRTLIRLHSKRVFVGRLALGQVLVRIGFWIMGIRAEVVDGE